NKVPTNVLHLGKVIVGPLYQAEKTLIECCHLEKQLRYDFSVNIRNRPSRGFLAVLRNDGTVSSARHALDRYYVSWLGTRRSVYLCEHFAQPQYRPVVQLALASQ